MTFAGLNQKHLTNHLYRLLGQCEPVLFTLVVPSRIMGSFLLQAILATVNLSLVLVYRAHSQ